MHTDHLLHDDADRLVVQCRIRDRRDGRHRLAHQNRLTDQEIADRHVVGLHDCAGHRVELGDLNTLRARERADAAAGAVVEGMINRFAVAEAFGLGTHVLRPREQRGDCRDRALRLADRALDAVIETLAVQPLRGKDVGLFEVQCQHFGALLRGDQPLAAICVAFLALGLRELLRILLGAHARSPIASAARTALAAAIPSPDFSLQRIAPAKTPPAANRFG